MLPIASSRFLEQIVIEATMAFEEQAQISKAVVSSFHAKEKRDEQSPTRPFPSKNG